jgi:2-polyprenyl-6-methoxyphenol hydroxylase-like FAD-dependent oxidoreductase
VDTDTTVLIAGAGPVGLALALALGRRGVDVQVLERGEGPGTASRASTFHPPSLEFLAELGVVDEVIRQGLRAPTYQLRDRQRGVVAEYDLSVLADETRFPFRVQLEQSKLCLLLAAELAGLPNVTLRYGAEVVDVESRPDEVVARLADGDRCTGAWLVGADGAHSAVRRSVGIEHEGFTYGERFLVVSTTADLREDLPDLASVNYVTDPDEWLVLLETPDHWRVLFPLGADEDAEAARLPDAVQARLQSVAVRDEPYPVLQTSQYEIHQRVAATFRSGRVLLAGDAAHLNNPLGGLGMNSGLLDAWSLARRLGAVLVDGAPETELDRYAALRREVALEVVDRQTRASKERLEERDPEARARHHAEQAAIAGDPERSRAHLRQTTLLATVPGHL